MITTEATRTADLAPAMLSSLAEDIGAMAQIPAAHHYSIEAVLPGELYAAAMDGFANGGVAAVEGRCAVTRRDEDVLIQFERSMMPADVVQLRGLVQELATPLKVAAQLKLAHELAWSSSPALRAVWAVLFDGKGEVKDPHQVLAAALCVS